jgi:hypothetical protein
MHMVGSTERRQVDDPVALDSLEWTSASVHRRMTDDDARRRFAEVRVARLATADVNGHPHG